MRVVLMRYAAWRAANRWFATVSHAVGGVVFQAVVALVAWLAGSAEPLWIGCAFATGAFYYREKTQYEYAVKSEPRASTATVWRRGWVPRTPHTWAEFLAPAIATAAVAWWLGPYL
jgi:hypothetical protein